MDAEREGRLVAEFAGWGPLGEMHRDLWERFSGELDERRRLATPNQLAQAVMVAVRSAAIDTSPINSPAAMALLAPQLALEEAEVEQKIDSYRYFPVLSWEFLTGSEAGGP